METVGRRFSWASLPLIATVARLLHKDLVLQVEYLRVQYGIVRSKVPGRIQFTDDERRSGVSEPPHPLWPQEPAPGCV